MITFSEFLLIAEAKRPISRGARSQIADVAGDLGSSRYSHDPGREAKARKLVSTLQSYDPKREKRELPVGRMAAKVASLVKRPRRTGADKESDFARADEIENTLRNESIDTKKYQQEIRTIHRIQSSDSTDPRNRVNLARYLEKRRLSVRPGGEYYDSSARKSSRPAVPTSRRNLSPEERQRRRDEDSNVDTRFSSKSSGSYGITRNPSKRRKQRAMGELP